MQERKGSWISSLAFPLVLMILGLLRLKVAAVLPKLFQVQGDLGPTLSEIVSALDWHRLISLGACIASIGVLAIRFRMERAKPLYWVESALWLGVLLLSAINP